MSAEQRAELEKDYRKGKTHSFRQRCQMILLKAENRTSLEVTEFLGSCEVRVNNWFQRFETEGVKGLETRPNRGQPPIPIPPKSSAFAKGQGRNQKASKLS